MSHRYTVWSLASASAKGAHSDEDHGVPWQNTTAGPLPCLSQATERPRHSNVCVNSGMGPDCQRPPTAGPQLHQTCRMGIRNQLTDALMTVMNVVHRGILAVSGGRLGWKLGPMTAVECTPPDDAPDGRGRQCSARPFSPMTVWCWWRPRAAT